MEWENITRIVKKVEEYTKVLQDENREVQKRCERYTKVLKEDLATPESVSQINEQLQKIEEDLNDVLEKANDKVFIEFVGATSSGKSSLINALLREERLPVGFVEATMCLIEICTTEDNDWKVEINDEHLSSGSDKEAVKDLLNAMIGDKMRKKREKLRINEDSKVRVYWPARLSRKVLPDNIVLVDTPGFGDDEEKSDQIVSDSCRKADIIVAVMDVMSPSKAYVTRLVKEVNCQYTFGVFTKWDELTEKYHKGNGPKISLDLLRQKNTSKFEESVNLGTIRCRKGNIFFVDSQYVLRNPETGTSFPEGHGTSQPNEDKSCQEPTGWSPFWKSVVDWVVEYLPTVTPEKAKKGVTDGRKGKESQTEEISTAGAEEFLKFETQLAKSAKELKGELLKTQLKSVIEKSENVIEKLKSIVEERKELKIDHLEKKLTFLKDGGEELSEICSKAKRSMLTDLDAKFKQVVRKIDESAKKKKPLDVGNKELEVTLTMVTEKANEDLKDWCARMNSVLPLARKSVLMKESEIEQMKSEEMPKDRYNCYIDPYTYYTSNRAWTFLVTGGICFALTGVGVVASIVGVAAATTAAASSVIGGLAAGTATGVGTRFLKIGDMIKRRQPISPMEQRCRKDFLVEKCKEVHERNKEVVKGEIDRVSEEKRGELENVKVYMQQGIRDLQAPEHVLNKLCTDLKDISRKIKGIRRNIDGLHW